ncbi:hypothetical protein EFM07_05275 [Lactococcus lactis]|uniref:hypothetical protein n=1 Tax=Lactococcus lactis TaxID=1358 RepID=UPI00223A76D4|nr:hypothetical protein [Lactococcus lactis]MCT1226930.1 hypothetical protein [Lactococcus lactis]
MSNIHLSVSADYIKNSSEIDESKVQKLIDNPEDITNTGKMVAEELKDFGEFILEEAEKVNLPTQRILKVISKLLLIYNSNSSIYHNL